MGRKFLKKELKKWDIEDAADLRNTINWLITQGRREEFDQLRNELTPLSEKTRNKYIKDHPNYGKLYLANYGLKILPHSGIAAYDTAWSIYLCRVGKALGLLSKHEASEFMFKAAKLAQQSYDDWNEFFNAFHLGSYFGSIDLEVSSNNKYNFLLSLSLISHKKSPLNKIPWKNDFLVGE